jgi:hypothetical protein
MKPAGSLTETLLIRSLLAGPDRAEDLWRKWRANSDIREIGSAAPSLIPLFGNELDSWIDDNADKRVILGIRKHAWSHNRVRLHQAWTAAEHLRSAGIQSLVVGAAASALSLPSRTLALWQLTLLVRRDEALKATRRLNEAGWHVRGNPLSESTLNTHSSVDLECSAGSSISLCWQLFPCPSHIQPRLEAMIWQTRRSVSWNGKSLAIPAPALHLIEVLLRGETWDALRLCEALLLITGVEVDWRLFRAATALSLQPQRVALSLACLRKEWNARVPLRLLLASRAESVRPYRQLRALARDYQVWIWRTEKRHSARLFVDYLRQRWNATHAFELPLLAFERLLRSR